MSLMQQISRFFSAAGADKDWMLTAIAAREDEEESPSGSGDGPTLSGTKEKPGEGPTTAESDFPAKAFHGRALGS